MLKKLVKGIPLELVDSFERRLLNSYRLTLKFLTKTNPELLEAISRKKAERMFAKAKKEVPAYRKVAKKAESFEEAPVIDKENYIKKFSYEERCCGGRFPEEGNIDESSGSSGKPTQWVRSYEEELMLQKAINFEYEYLFKTREKDKKFIVISAWSSGPWATGIKFCEIMEHYSLVKETSTNIGDILETMRIFGKGYAYLIAGYPPFLRLLLDKKFNFKDYKIHLLTGGEATSLAMEDFFRRKLGRKAEIISAYGCSDIDIGIGVETPFSKFIRRLADKRKKLKKELFGTEGETPMVFQYNPLMHYIENIEGQEFLITLLDINTASPKVRYAIHDWGGKIGFKEMRDKVKKVLGIDMVKAYKGKGEILKLPFLWVKGRVDGTLSFDGANVSPKDIEEVILRDRFLSAKVNRFKMKKAYTKDHHVRFRLLIELKAGLKGGRSLREKIQEKIRKGLVKINSDFAESLANNPQLAPRVFLYQFDEKPFREDDERIKLKYT